jgi:hypothetical protein
MRARLTLAITLAMHGLLSAQSRDVIVAVDLGTHLDPIARFDGSTWVPVPASGLGRLAPMDWRRWYASGASTSIRLRVAEPIGRCALPRRLAVANPPAPPAGVFDRTYVGVAATAPLGIDGLRRLSPDAPELKALSRPVASLFERRSQAHGVSQSMLARVPMTIDFAFATARGVEPPIYYFEASKRIPDAGGTPAEDPTGIVRIAVSGWLRASDGGFVPVGSKSELSWEPDVDTPQPPGLLPLGVVQQGDDRVWVMKGRPGARDAFVLYSVRRSEVRTLFTVDAAAC